MYQNPYMSYQMNPQINQTFQPQVLPPQQILTANGKASIDALKMSPNSSALIADATKPIVWKCTSDSLGNVTSEPFSITPYVEAPPVDVGSLEQRVANIEQIIAEIGGKKDEPVVKQSGKGSDK